MKTWFCFVVGFICATMVHTRAQCLTYSYPGNINQYEHQVKALLAHSGEMLASILIESGSSLRMDTSDEYNTGNYLMVLTHKTKPKVKYIPEGKKIIIWCGEDRIKGRITSIAEDCIYVNSIPFSPEEIDKVRAFFPGTTAGGALVTAGGAGAAGLGGYLAAISIITLIEAGGESWAVFWGTLGLIGSIPILSVGVVLIPAGIIIITQGRTFNVVTKWRLSIVEQLK